MSYYCAQLYFNVYPLALIASHTEGLNEGKDPGQAFIDMGSRPGKTECAEAAIGWMGLAAAWNGWFTREEILANMPGIVFPDDEEHLPQVADCVEQVAAVTTLKEAAKLARQTKDYRLHELFEVVRICQESAERDNAPVSLKPDEKNNRMLIYSPDRKFSLRFITDNDEYNSAYYTLEGDFRLGEYLKHEFRYHFAGSGNPVEANMLGYVRIIEPQLVQDENTIPCVTTPSYDNCLWLSDNEAFWLPGV